MAPASPREGRTSDGSPTTAATATPLRHSSRFVSEDLNVRCSGHIIEHKEPGRIDGIRLELDDGDKDAITVIYPQLVSIHTRPESQTLVSINTGEKLLTLETPLLPSENDSPEADQDENALDDGDDDEDVSDLEGTAPSRSDRKAKPGRRDPQQKKRRTIITLHEGFLPASEAPQLEESPLYSSTFRIVIDGPSYPLPHFDPASLAPPTPAVRPSGSGHGAMNDSTSAYGGVLNSPTLQRALLSPLLSPQRRAASQGSDMSVPPLSLGLSRASRASFNASERPKIDGHSSGPAHVTLLTLIPSLAPPRSAPPASSTPQVGPSSAHAPNSFNSNQAISSSASTLAGTLTTSLSTAAKHTAEEILALRRSHDAYQRRAKAELEVLEARIENARAEAGNAIAVGGTDAVVRGFKTKEERAKEQEERNVSASRSRDRGRSPIQRRTTSRDPHSNGSVERSSTPDQPAGVTSPNVAPTRPTLVSVSSTSSSTANRDEEASALIRAQDEREEDERGRSRSRSRRSGLAGKAAPTSDSSGAATPTGGVVSGSSSQRSTSRSKSVAEATMRAVEGAKERQGSSASASATSSPKLSQKGQLAPPSTSLAGGERPGRSPLSREAKLAPSPEREPGSPQESRTTRRASTSASGDHAKQTDYLPPSSGSQPLPPSRPANSASVGSTTPAFAPSSHALVAIPESDELSLPLERTYSGGLQLNVPKQAPPAVQVKPEGEEDSEPPFEMDEDVAASGSESVAAASQTESRVESPSLERDSPASERPLLANDRPPSQQQIPASSSFKPGSFQRASALSASYNALLASTKSAPSRAVVQPVSPALNASRSPFAAPQSISEDQLPPFSPPEARSYMSSSAREDAQTALISATFEHAERTRRADDGSSRGSSTTGGRGYVGPDPRDVRKGEQKIRDVLAMDVPSHRPRGGPASQQRQTSSRSNPSAGDFDRDEDEDEVVSSEEDDTVEELAPPADGRAVGMSQGASSSQARDGDGGGSSMPVGSLPIALGRPSTVNAALSSWRPDPERLWTQQRRERKTSLSGGKEGMWVPPLRSSSGSGAKPSTTQPQHEQVLAGGQAALLLGSEDTPTRPVEIGSPAIPRPADVGGANSGSSLARSLRAQQGVGSFVQRTASGANEHRRSGGEGTGSALPTNGRDVLENERRSAERNGPEDGQGKRQANRQTSEDGVAPDDDDDEFVPPHLVKERREREDEEWLSRSVPKS